MNRVYYFLFSSKNLKYEEQDDHKPIIHLTTHKPLQGNKVITNNIA